MAQIPASGGPPRELSDGVSFADWTPTGGGRLAVVRQVASEHHLEYPSGHVVLPHGQHAQPPRASRRTGSAWRCSSIPRSATTAGRWW